MLWRQGPVQDRLDGLWDGVSLDREREGEKGKVCHGQRLEGVSLSRGTDAKSRRQNQLR
jgi:hypothetical protein